MALKTLVIVVDDEAIDFKEFIAEMKDYLEDDMVDGSITIEVGEDDQDATDEDLAISGEDEEEDVDEDTGV